MYNKNDLIKAMDDRNLVDFYYDGQPIRRTAPHTIYISTAGNVNLDAFQCAGYSKSGNLPDWRNFKLSEIQNLTILDEKFDVAQGYKPYSDKYRNCIHKI